MSMDVNSKRKRMDNKNSRTRSTFEDQLSRRRLYNASLEDRIRFLEMDNEASKLHLEILKARLREYEPSNDSSLSHILRSEKNLKESLERVTNLKIMLLAKNLTSSNGESNFQRYQEPMNTHYYQNHQISMQASVPSFYGNGSTGMNRFGAQGISYSNGVGPSFLTQEGTIFPATYTARAQYGDWNSLVQAAQHQGMSRGDLNGPYSSIVLNNTQSGQSGFAPSTSAQNQLTIYNGNNNRTYNNLWLNGNSSSYQSENGQIGSAPPMSTQMLEVPTKEVTMFASGSNNETRNLEQRGESSTQNQQVENQIGQPMIRDGQVLTDDIELDGEVLAQLLSARGP